VTDIAALFGAMAAAPPMPEAACRGQWELFDITTPDNPGRMPAAVAQARRIALEVCAGCPELSPCGWWLDGLPANLRPLGVVAGRIIDRRRSEAVA
jgi:hypothetical protein